MENNSLDIKNTNAFNTENHDIIGFNSEYNQKYRFLKYTLATFGIILIIFMLLVFVNYINQKHANRALSDKPIFETAISISEK